MIFRHDHVPLDNHIYISFSNTNEYLKINKNDIIKMYCSEPIIEYIVETNDRIFVFRYIYNEKNKNNDYWKVPYTFFDFSIDIKEVFEKFDNNGYEINDKYVELNIKSK